MIEIRFQHDLYDVAALDEAIATYGAYGTLDLAREASTSVLKVSVGVTMGDPERVPQTPPSAAEASIDERTLAAELGNFVLGMTIEKARAAQDGAEASK